MSHSKSHQADIAKPLASQHKLLSPLSYQLSPKSFEQYKGQAHLIAPGKPLRIWIENDTLQSMILFGPPGVGKTALARLMALRTKADFIPLNAVMAKVQDLRDAIQTGRLNQSKGQKTILFIDEIHRFNKAQQDALLPDLERGTIILVGATTENPFFSVNASILSRVQLFELYLLDDESLAEVLDRALTDDSVSRIGLSESLKALLIRQCHGDARRLINQVSALTNTLANSIAKPSLEDLETLIRQAGTAYTDDTHYDLASAFIKSVRGSDVNAALYWLARMIKSAHGPEFIARRLLILASEDIGNADPQALILASAALQAVQYIGFPEAQLTLSQLTIYLCRSPKSNEATTAIYQALTYIDQGNIHAVPNHLRDASHSGLKKMGRGSGYQNPHNGPTDGQRYWDGDISFVP